MSKKPLRIGFDLDGVLLYNPVRVIRPIISLLKKKKVIQRRELQFFVPKTKQQQFLWRLFHKSSLFVSPAVNQLAELVASGEVEAYIVTARFAHLKADTQYWFNKFSQKNIFKASFMNEQDEQPHLFKLKKIEELKLDYFVEDNWDIVNFLSQKKLATKISWISNFGDRKINYHSKFFTLKSFIDSLNFKKKILFLTDYYLPHWTGLSKSLNLMVGALETKAVCSVLTIKHHPDLKNIEKNDQHFIHRVNYWFSFSRAKFAPAILLSYLKLVLNQDLVVINSPFTFVLPATILAKILRKKVFIFHQGDLTLPTGFINKIIQLVFNIASFMAFSLADGLATYTNDYVVNSRLLKYFVNKSKNFIVPIPMTPTVTKSLTKITELRKEHQLIIGLSGRFVEEKGFDLLFKAIPKIKNKNIHFVFAGEKNMGYEDFFSQNQQLYNQVKKEITFLGLLAGDELESFYFSLDALVMPSRSDCFGLVQAEAVKYDKPVIVTNIIGGRDMVRTTHFGEVADSENPTSLAEKIDLFAKNKNSYKKYLPNVKKYFDYEKNFHRLSNWLEL